MPSGNSMGTKHCNGCNQDKPLSEFHFYMSGSKAGKPRTRCKACKRIYDMEYRQSHPANDEKRQLSRDRSNAWRIANRERKRQMDREYHKNHKEERRANDLAKTEYIRQRDREWRYRTGRSKPLKDSKELPAYLGVYIAERVLSNYFEDVQRMPWANPGYDYICKRGFKIDAKSSVLHHRENRVPRWTFPTRHNVIADYFLCLGFDTRESLNPMHVWLVPSKDVETKPAISIGNFDKSLSRWAKYEKSIDKVITACDAAKSELNP